MATKGPARGPDQAEVEKFHAALGYAITSWQGIENQLLKVFRIVSNCRDERLAAAIFFSPQDFSNKLDLVHSAARLFLKQLNLAADWRQLRKRLINESKIRNRLVHFQLYGVTEVKNDGTVGVRRMILQPNWFDPNEAFKPTNEAKLEFERPAIEEAARRFDALAQDTANFAATVFAAEEQRAAQAQPPHSH